MWLPTKAQIDSVSRHAITIAGTAITIFGLQAKGFNLQQITATINALGSVANDIVLLLAAAAPLYAALRAGHTASPSEQVKSAAAVIQDNSKPIQQAQSVRIMADAVRDVGATPGPAAFEAKTALLDAVAAQPEVVGLINVTDSALASATISEQVKAAA